MRPNRVELTPEEFRDARVLKAAAIAGRRGDFGAAQEALAGTGLTVDAELSDMDGLVVRDAKNVTLNSLKGRVSFDRKGSCAWSGGYPSTIAALRDHKAGMSHDLHA